MLTILELKLKTEKINLPPNKQKIRLTEIYSEYTRPKQQQKHTFNQKNQKQKNPNTHTHTHTQRF